MIVALMLASMTSPSAVGASPPNEIVVRGKSLDALQTDLDRCIRDHCPLRADVVASVRVGEALFRLGRLQAARQLLQRAIERDRDRERSDPDAMAALYEATSTVASHDGEQQVMLAVDADRLRLLKQTRGADAPETLRAALDYDDNDVARSTETAASTAYRRLAEEADAARQPAIGALARLRLANLAYKRGETKEGDRLIQAVVDAPVPPGIRSAAEILRIRMSHGPAKAALIAQYRASLGALRQAKPTLLSAPPPPQPADLVDLTYFDRTDTHTQGEDFFGARWADISFAIHPDGTVDAPEMLRGTMGSGDVASIKKSLAHRVYAPFPQADGDHYRVERWTLTADYATPIGSLIRRRLRNPHFVSLDITTGPDRAPDGETS